MKRISRENHHFWFDRTIPSVLGIDPGEEVVIETYNSRTADITGLDCPAPAYHPEGPNPITGPILVRGSEPGDQLLVKVLDIQTEEFGYCNLADDSGLLRHLTKNPYWRVIRIKDGMVHFNEALKFPWRPVVGVMGCAPAEGRASSVPPHDIGGNMDHTGVTVGATVHLPVQVPGALFGVGDIHASQGDGEMNAGGIDISGEVTASIDLRKNDPISRPFIVLEDKISTYAHAETIEDAFRIAAEDMHRLITRGLGISAEEASVLLAIQGDLGIGQACDGTINPTVRCDFPRFFEP